jgi:putative intracellular protease/amidase
MLTRRDLVRVCGKLFSLLPAAGTAAGILAPPLTRTAAGATEPGHDMSHAPPHWFGNEQITMLLYPGFTALDLIGPQYMFASLMGATVPLAAKTREPVTSDTGVAMLPTATLDESPRDPTILFVPGGTRGTLAAMRDDAILAFLADRGGRASYVTSVCTGSLVLGAAGLLEGYRATSHWLTRPLLPLFGAIEDDARVAWDRNRVTGAGVTAGIDFGLSLVAKLRDRDYAETLQLLAEYAPEPPFAAGSPAQAEPRQRAALEAMLAPFLAEVRAIAAARRERPSGMRP